MKKGILAVALIMAAGAFAPNTAAAKSDISIIASTRYESHTMENTKLGDNAQTTAFTFIKNTGPAASVIASIGHRLDLDDNESDGLSVSLGYVRNISKSSYITAGYSNYRAYKSTDDGSVDDSTDMLTVMHGWNVVKQDMIKLSLNTAISTDTAFDNNRMFSESLNFSGPVGKKLRWGVGYQFGYSLVDHRHSVNVLDYKVSKKVSRRGSASLGHRRAEYKAPGNDQDDNQWILAYSFRIR